MRTCTLCGAASVESLIEFGEHPIAHRFLDAPKDDEYTHAVTLGFCNDCGLLQLIDPIPAEELYTEYNWLSSWKWNPHLADLLTAVERLPGLTPDARILEVGSNDGSFLDALAKLGFGNSLGIEPAVDAYRAALDRGVATMRAYFTPQTAEAVRADFGSPDLLVARHVLEHVADLGAFAEAIRTILQPGAYVVVEVPDFEFFQSARDYTAVWEEQPNLFTAPTLTRFLGQAGVQVDRCESVDFTGKALVAFGRRSEGHPRASVQAVSELRELAYAFRDEWPAFRVAMREYLTAERRDGRRVVVYGAGHRAASLINVCDLSDLIEAAIDDQVERQGKYMPGSRLPVLPAEMLSEEPGRTLCLLSVNAENEEAVMGRHAAFVERGGEFVSVNPPSPRLPSFWKKAQETCVRAS